MLVREAQAADARAIAAIYADAVLHGLGTFEEVPPSSAEMARRMAGVLAHGLPYLVAEDAKRVLGYAYASPFRPRSGYRFTVEDTVYIAPDAKGRGVGRALLEPVIAVCEAMQLRRMIAAIGDSGNSGSIALHSACGFQPAGVLPAAGYKLGRWVDVVFMQRPLGSGDAPPDGGGLTLGEA